MRRRGNDRVGRHLRGVDVVAAADQGELHVAVQCGSAVLVEDDAVGLLLDAE